MPASLRLGLGPTEPRFGSITGDPATAKQISGANAVIPCVLDATPQRLIDIINAAITTDVDRAAYFNECRFWRYEDDTGVTLTEAICSSYTQADAADPAKCQWYDLQSDFDGSECSSLWIRTVSGNASAGRLVGMH